jgi:hypothetical protein
MHTKFLSENLKGKRPLGRHRHRWEYNMRVDFREMVWECVGWTALVNNEWQLLMNTVMNLHVS